MDGAFHAFDELAMRIRRRGKQQLRIPGKKPSILRASILSGLTRKEVQCLVAEPLEPATVETERYNRAARVLAAWTRDPDFTDARG